MMEWIKTDRGRVRVIEAACAKRPCLHVHWSRHSSETQFPETGAKKGWKIESIPLVCVRNEEHGCPHPLPEPVA